jgi:hypothetical protein
MEVTGDNNNLKKYTTMSGNKDLRRAKHEAYQKKQAAKGEKVIKWIFIGLIVLGMLFAFYATRLV